jgi:hypothetical protein
MAWDLLRVAYYTQHAVRCDDVTRRSEMFASSKHHAAATGCCVRARRTDIRAQLDA